MNNVSGGAHTLASDPSKWKMAQFYLPGTSLNNGYGVYKSSTSQGTPLNSFPCAIFNKGDWFSN